MHTANLAVRFLLELGALAAIAGWGLRAGGTTTRRLALGAGVPLAIAVLWSAFVGPGSDAPAGVKVVLQVLVFGAAAAALSVVRRPALASAFAAAVALNATLMIVWEQ